MIEWITCVVSVRRSERVWMAGSGRRLFNLHSSTVPPKHRTWRYETQRHPGCGRWYGYGVNL